MNILHMKYAVEVAKFGSLNKAAEALMIAQPNISRSIKELEADLGITIFKRSAKGMVLTPEGEEFVDCARDLLRRIDKLEKSYRDGLRKKRRFSISVPRASYISAAMAEFSKSLGDAPVEIYYKETNSKKTIKKLLENEYKLGIIRYADNYDKYYLDLLEEKGLAHEPVAEFSYVLLMSRDNPLAARERLAYEDLSDYMEIAHADPYVPTLSMSKAFREELPDKVNQRIFVFERASQFDLLSENPKTFMWTSPIPQQLLDRYDLVQRVCEGNRGGEIHAKLQPMATAGIRNLPHHVALAPLPGAVLHGMLRVSGGPKAEAVVMLGGEDGALHARLLHGKDPFVGIQVRGVEDGGILVAKPPFSVGIGVDGEVQKSVKAHLKPGELARGGAHRNGGIQKIFHRRKFLSVSYSFISCMVSQTRGRVKRKAKKSAYSARFSRTISKKRGACHEEFQNLCLFHSVRPWSGRAFRPSHRGEHGDL